MIIYKAINRLNKKIYIGQTILTLEQRKAGHLNHALNRNSKNYFHTAIRSYGAEVFEWSIIGECFNKEELNQAEKACIEFYQSNNKIYGYNLTTGGDSFQLTKEARKKISDSLKGKKLSPEHIAKLKKRKVSSITKHKISTSLKGRKVNPRTGYKMTPEAIENVRKARLGKSSGTKGKTWLEMSIQKWGHEIGLQKYNERINCAKNKMKTNRLVNNPKFKNFP